ncbi:hypothetical protein BH09PLA1_BH09PLA1_11720 [soil metagenome]
MDEAMELTSALSNLSQAKTTSQIQFAVAKKVLDNQKLQGNAAIELINAATEGASSAGDELVAAATGLGSQLDVYG